jgi:hypothetical protein
MYPAPPSALAVLDRANKEINNRNSVVLVIIPSFLLKCNEEKNRCRQGLGTTHDYFLKDRKYIALPHHGGKFYLITKNRDH